MQEGRLNLRKKEYKKTIEDPRQWREENTSKLRKDKRLESLVKRRLGADDIDPMNVQPYNEDNEDGETADRLSVTQTEDAEKIPLSTLCQWISQTEDTELLLRGVTKIRFLVANVSNPAIDEVLNSGAVPQIVKCLMHENKSVAYESAWIITNLTSGTHSQCATTVSYNIMPGMLKLIIEGDATTSEQALWCMGNLAGDCADFRDLLYSNNLFDLLEETIQKHERSISFLVNAAWVTSNMFRHSPVPPMTSCEQGCRIMRRLIEYSDPKISSDICWGLSYLTNSVYHYPSSSPNPRTDLCIASGFCPKLIELLRHTWDVTRFAALRTVGQIAAGTNEQCQVLMELGLVPALNDFITMTSRAQQLREIMWIISNISAGTTQQLDELIKYGSFKLMLKHFETDITVKTEIVWALANAIMNANGKQMEALVREDVLKHLCTMLSTDHTGRLVYTAPLVNLTLRALEILLKNTTNDYPEMLEAYLACLEPIAFDQLENLANLEEMGAEGNNIRELATSIITDYLPCAYESDEEGNIEN